MFLELEFWRALVILTSSTLSVNNHTKFELCAMTVSNFFYIYSFDDFKFGMKNANAQQQGPSIFFLMGLGEWSSSEEDNIT